MSYIKRKTTLIFGILMLCMVSSTLSAAVYNGRYGWPTLKSPKALIICEQTKTAEESMLLESLSGLAAKAVNNGRLKEMVWRDVNGNPSYERILKQSMAALGIKDEKRMDVWELLAYLKKKKIVKGYVLYEPDRPVKNKIQNYSSNVATVYSSLLSGAMISTSLESKAKAAGLKMLKDARTETTMECFNRNKSRLNNCSALSIRPSVSNMRDFAIAHGLMLYADERPLIDAVLEWVRPLSPILGWGCGDEYDSTSAVSEWGHYNTASDWCVNLPFISAAASYIPLEKANELSPSQIDFADSSYVHSFVMSDGDNMQWTIGAFADNPVYAGHAKAKESGTTWTLCPINLSVVSPVSWNEVVHRQGTKNSIIEYGGGYQYPDLFASKRSNRKELLREFARRVNSHLKELNVKIFGAIFKDVESPEAQEAVQIYAEELEDITGMIAIQYFPYELGDKIFWYKNKKGEDIPLVTANYSLWNEVHAQRPFCGTPEYVASLINRNLLSRKSKGYSWTIVHAWSDFGKTSKCTEHPAVGVNPILATENLMLDDIRVVSLNELLWRVRMKYHPEQVRRLMQNP